MSETLSERQALILWCLLGRQGEALQGEIVPAVGKADRDILKARGYVDVAKRGRALHLTVTDRGWNWAGAHLSATLPANYRVLQDWLARLDAHLAATGETLAAFVGEAPRAPEAQPSTKPARRGKVAVEESGTPRGGAAGSGTAGEAAAGKAGSKAGTKAGKARMKAPKAAAKAPEAAAKARIKTASGRSAATGAAARSRKASTTRSAAPAASTQTPSPARLRARIEEAYLELTGGAKAKAVRLSALRAELADLDRATVDDGLATILSENGKATLSQFSDPRSLTLADHDAAFSPAGEPFHILWIEP